MKKINPKIILIMASGFINPNQKAIMEKNGLKLFVQKPYYTDVVIKLVREVLDKKNN